MSTIVEQEDKTVANCIFCKRHLERDEIVRYRGAISCQECAEKPKAEQERFTSPLFFLIGSIGALIAAVGSIVYNLLRLSRFLPFASYQWTLQSFSLISLGLALLSTGQIGLYFNWDRKWGLILAALALTGCIGGLIHLQNYISFGSLLYLEEVPPIYILSRYVFEGGLLAMLALNGGLMVLTRDDHGNEMLTLATAGGLLLGSAITFFLVPAFTLLSIYFVTARLEM